MHFRYPILCSLLIFGIPLTGCHHTPKVRLSQAERQALQADAQAWISTYSARYQTLASAANEADWQANIKIVEGDASRREAAEAANEALVQFTGATDTIEKTRALLKSRDALTPLQVRQLERILYIAADAPQTVASVVTSRIGAEAKQNEMLYGFDFQMNGKSITPNDIDRILTTSKDEQERRMAWEASKEVGVGLKDGLANLVQLRNQTVQALGYDDYFAYQVSEYGMSVDEMMALNKRFIRDVWPLYRELHTWARYTLAERFGAKEVPKLLPAHWLPNRWGQDWSALVDVEGFDLDHRLAKQTPEWIVKQAEAFYVSLSFPPLPDVFWQKSSLYPVPANAAFKKNNHASAWHMDLQADVRSLMSVEPNTRWWSTTHHELGHIYYYVDYSTPSVPLLLRRGANRGFHEAVGSLLGMASMQKPFLQEVGLLPAQAKVDEMQLLLKEALDAVVFIPFSAGTMSHFERDLYATDLDKGTYNERWWDYVKNVQGIEPPSARGETYCDAASKTHINNDAAQYYDYAISYVLLYQLHQHIAQKILHQDPHQTNYFGRQDVGRFLHDILSKGAKEDWRQVMKEALGSDLSAKPLLAYFEPLMQHLKQVNAGRQHALPAKPSI